MAEPIPEGAKLSPGRIAGKAELPTPPNYSGAPGAVSAGVGAIGGAGGGGVGGVGMNLDLTRLFDRPTTPPKLYRYDVQRADGFMRQVDSPLDLQPGGCVNIIETSRPGYPRLAATGC